MSVSDEFDFEESEQQIEQAEKDLVDSISQNCLEVAVRKVVPSDIMAIFELKSAEETIDRCSELRTEVLSFITIAFENVGFSKMYINLPKHNLAKLRRLLKPFSEEHAKLLKRNAIAEVGSLEPRLSAILKPLFNEEAIFYEQLSEILKGAFMGKTLSDSDKHIFSTEKPFNSSSGGSEEEARDSVNDMQGAMSSGYDQLSSALSATSTSILSIEDEFEE